MEKQRLKIFIVGVMFLVINSISSVFLFKYESYKHIYSDYEYNIKTNTFEKNDKKIKIIYEDFIKDILFINIIINFLITYFIYYKTKKMEEEKFLLKVGNIESLATQNSMSVLTENIHHELNSPISVITLKCKKIKKILKNKKIYDKYNFNEHFELVETSIEQIKTILQNMSDFKHLKYSNGNKNLLDIVNGAIKMIKVTSDSEVEFKVDTSLKKYMINHNKGLKNADLIGVFINLFKNSIEANANKIIISVSKVNNKYIYIEIEDNGNGIPFNIKKILFEPNKSSKTDTLGIRGNGLFLTKNLLNVFDGDINLKFSEVNKGTKFILKIPIEVKK